MSSIYFRGVNQRGFGTYPLRGAELAAALEAALAAGYRAIDTAQMYGNEADVGAALAAAAVPRRELLVTTKVHPDRYTEAEFLPSVERSLKDLRLDAIDVLLLHWPPAGGDVVPSLRLLNDALRRGLARHAGVSNYTAAMMRTARSVLEAPCACNQVEFHPLLNQDRLLAAAAETGIPLVGYSTVARGAVFAEPLISELAAFYGRAPGQIVLRWILQKGVAVNTQSKNPANIRANFEVMDFTLSSIDMARLDALTARGHRIVTAARVPWAPVWD
jgi:2,5-diketo-D-gluconate reductase B